MTFFPICDILSHIVGFFEEGIVLEKIFSTLVVLDKKNSQTTIPKFNPMIPKSEVHQTKKQNGKKIRIHSKNK